jgi:hypothetical protein
VRAPGAKTAAGRFREEFALDSEASLTCSCDVRRIWCVVDGFSVPPTEGLCYCTAADVCRGDSAVDYQASLTCSSVGRGMMWLLD